MSPSIMPKKSGREVFDEISGLHPGIKTIFMSGYSNTILEPLLRSEHACRFIPKPIVPPALLNAVRAVLDER